MRWTTRERGRCRVSGRFRWTTALPVLAAANGFVILTVFIMLVSHMSVPADLRAAAPGIVPISVTDQEALVEWATIQQLALAVAIGVAGLGVIGLLRATAVARAQDQAIRALEIECGVLRASEKRFRSLALSTSDIIMILGEDATIQYQSPSAERIVGCVPSTPRDASILTPVHPEDLETVRSLISESISRPWLSLAAEVRLQLADESWCYFDVVATNLLRDPELGGIIVALRDITERKDLEQALAHQAFHDALTGLPNRRLFIDGVERALARSTSHGTPLAVMFLDLDNFKIVNDSLGHPVGDQLLKAVTERIQDCLRRKDVLARLSGDEFAILVEGLDGVEDVERLASRIQQQMRRPFQIGDRELFAGLSIGIVLNEPAHTCANDLLRDADLAMYRAKSNGKGRCAVFHRTMNTRITERLSLETSLRGALERGELAVYYQPVVDLSTGVIVGCEALARWLHPERGVVQPGDFIPLAEETGLIVPIGAWILEEACRQAERWKREHNLSLRVSVNVSPRQFESPDFVDTVTRTLAETGLPLHHLKLELTEGVLMRDVGLAVARLRELEEMSVQIAVDDFGTGYSSLAYLRQFTVSQLKIDRAFIARIGADPLDDAMTRSVITLAHNLGMQVVGKGIETAEQKAFLQAEGCDLGQGYYFSPPLPSQLVETLLLPDPAVHGRPTVVPRTPGQRTERAVS